MTPASGMAKYRRRWLLSACAYNSWQQGNMRLTRNSHLISGWEIVGGAFAASKQSVKLAFWRASFVAVTFTSKSGGCLSVKLWNTNLGMGGGLQPWQIHCQSSQACYCPWPCSSEFSWVFWHFLRHGETITCKVTGRRKRGKATSQH